MTWTVPEGGQLLRFFDTFGLIVFTFILFDAILDVKKNKKNWRAWVRLGVGIAGLCVDLFNVNYI